MNNINFRINELVSHFSNGNNSDFAKKVGVNEANVRNYISGTEPKFSFLEKVTTVFEINYEWLLTGKGEMLKSDIDNLGVQVAPPDTGIPLVSITAIGGYGNSVFSFSDRDVKDFYVVPKFKHKKVDFMIEVEGASMYPKYNSGDVVACRIIHEQNFIQWNKTHVIATREQGIIIKRIKPCNDNEYLLMLSDNKDYDPFAVPKEEIKGIAIVVGVIRLE